MIPEIVLGVTTGVASLGAGGLGWLVRRKGKAHAAEIAEFGHLSQLDAGIINEGLARQSVLGKELAEERSNNQALQDTLAQAVADHNAAVAVLKADHAAAVAVLKGEHAAEVTQFKAEHAVQVAQLEGEFAGAMAASQRTALRLETLLAGHDFHVGGKVKSHGRDLILYNCVTCSPETNVRVIAPEGFFAGGDQWLAQT